jgi:hypothetical protein
MWLGNEVLDEGMVAGFRSNWNINFMLMSPRIKLLGNYQFSENGKSQDESPNQLQFQNQKKNMFIIPLAPMEQKEFPKNWNENFSVKNFSCFNPNLKSQE